MKGRRDVFSSRDWSKTGALADFPARLDATYQNPQSVVEKDARTLARIDIGINLWALHFYSYCCRQRIHPLSQMHSFMNQSISGHENLGPLRQGNIDQRTQHELPTPCTLILCSKKQWPIRLCRYDFKLWSNSGKINPRVDDSVLLKSFVVNE